MTKADLIVATAQASRMPKKGCKAVVEAFLKELVHASIRAQTTGGAVELRGFGTFEVRTRKPRPARNPHTGEVIPLPIRKVFRLLFSPEISKSISHKE